MQKSPRPFVAALASSLALAACQPPEVPPAAAPAPTVAVTADTAATAAAAPAEPEPAPAATASAEAAPTPPPAPEPFVDIEVSPGHVRLNAGAELVKAGDNVRAKLELVKAVTDVDANGPLDAKMAGHALLGRACAALKDTKCAAAHYQTVRELWKDPAAGQKAIEKDGGDDKEKAARLRRALNAVGEALFQVGEEKRLASEAEKFPVYTGSGKKGDVMKHLQTKLPPWVKARRTKIEEAEKAYRAILDLQPAPPPRWVIAAAARVGQMWGKFTAEFRAAPIPTEWKKSGPVPGVPDLTYEELRRSYYEKLDEASEPMKDMARSAFTKCQDMSQKYAYKDSFSQHCETWLAKNYPAATAASATAPATPTPPTPTKP